ncbi:amidase [Bordetella genomosp. 13]|uniref:Amidase n=1 Tax=Bordetella genomosp. 13 TaxID=463040 RepID=A0A1W6Z6I4_9BORD|nr:amidase [Bordetella genomosp. 13]ARP92917.1 amidase [Bordetella genomosp. 13]
MSETSICDMTALQMRAEIAAGHLGAREVVQAHLARIERWNPAINAIVTLDAEGALRQAAQADEAQAAGKPLGLLHGLPVAHKDSFLTAGMRTTYGSPVFRDFVPTRDSVVVERQRAAGAITLGKTNMPEFGAGSHTFNTVFGATRNPYDRSRSAGGSSGGAAAALAARMLPLADGTDMGGSLRNPAGFCNVVGLRPSPGRVPNLPSAASYGTLTVAGPMARTVSDAALMLAALAGADARDPLTIEQDPRRFLDPLERDFGGVRVAFTLNWGGLPVEPAVTQVLQAQLPIFEQLGCALEEACPDFGDADAAFHALRAQQFAIAQGDTVRNHRDRVKQTVIWNTELGWSQPAERLVRAERERTALFERMHAFMQRHEFVIGPVSQVAPFNVDLEYPLEIDNMPMMNYIDWMRSGYYISLTGHPAISVPCGFTADGLPVGLQIVGRHRDEWGVLQMAYAFEQATRFWQRAPVL